MKKKMQRTQDKQWKLKDHNTKIFAKNVVKEADWEMNSDAKDTQTKMKTCVTRITKKILGESERRIQRSGIRTFQGSYQGKQKSYLALGKCRNEEYSTKYKKLIREVKLKTFEEVLLDSKGENIQDDKEKTSETC